MPRGLASWWCAPTPSRWRRRTLTPRLRHPLLLLQQRSFDIEVDFASEDSSPMRWLLPLTSPRQDTLISCGQGLCRRSMRTQTAYVCPGVWPIGGVVAASSTMTRILGRAVPPVQALAPETFARGVAENGATRARFRLFPLLLMILAMVS